VYLKKSSITNSFCVNKFSDCILKMIVLNAIFDNTILYKFSKKTNDNFKT